MGFFKDICKINTKIKDITTTQLKEINDDVVYSILSIKTTGTNKFVDEIMSVSIIKYQNEEVIGKYYSLVKIKKFLDVSITSKTKITNKMLLKQGKDIYSVLAETLEFIGDSFLISHNAWDFEIPFLNQKLKKCKLTPISTNVIDTQRISKEIFFDKKLKHDLLSLSQRMKITIDKAKDFTSEYYVEVLFEVWKQLLIYFQTRKMTVYDWAIKIDY